MTHKHQKCVCDLWRWHLVSIFYITKNATTPFHKGLYFLPLCTLHKSIKIHTWVHTKFVTNSYPAWRLFEQMLVMEYVWVCVCLWHFVGQEKTSGKNIVICDGLLWVWQFVLWFGTRSAILFVNHKHKLRYETAPISSHSLMTKYLVNCGILLKNNCFAFCNTFPKSKLSPAREENTHLTHHDQLSLTNV